MTDDTSPAPDHTPDAQLIDRMRQGDPAATAEYFTLHLPRLTVAARMIAHGAVDADDLLAEAIARVLAQWKRGGGPDTNVIGYITTSMRHQLASTMRSPAAHLAVLDEKTAPPAVDAVRTIDLHQELRWVRTALERLPADQRAVLLHTVVEGRKPNELEDELGRSVPAIWTFKHRAKLALRQAMLQVMLDEDAGEEHAIAARGVPRVVPDTPEEVEKQNRGMAHILSCARCRAVWARFAAVGTGLGVSAVLVLHDGFHGTAAVAAAPAGAAAEGDGSDADGTGSPTPSVSAAAIGAGAGTAGAAASVAGAPAASAAADTAGAAPGAAGAGSPAPRRAPRRGRMVAAIAGGATLLTGGVLLIVFALLHPSSVDLPDAALGSGRPAAQISATAGDDGTTLEVDFSVPEHDWLIDSMTVDLPAGVTIVGAPEEWTCTGTGPTVCRTEAPNSSGGVLTLSSAAGSWAEQKAAVVIVATSSGETITAAVRNVTPAP